MAQNDRFYFAKNKAHQNAEIMILPMYMYIVLPTVHVMHTEILVHVPYMCIIVHVLHVPCSNNMILGILCTGVISSSDRVCRPHSGLDSLHLRKA